MQIHFAATGQPLIIRDSLSVTKPIAMPSAPKRAVESTAKFKTASAKWVDSREPFVSQPTFQRLKHHLNPLNRFFGNKSLDGCANTELIRKYQADRLKSAGADCINKEISVLKGTLERAGLWKPIEDDYQPLPIKESIIGRALTSDLEKKLFAAAESREEWRIAYLVALLLANTLLSPTEVFFRRIEDIVLREKLIYVRTGKNKYRVRKVPINNGNAFYAVTELLKIAKERGARVPKHFLIPYRVQPGVYDPSRPARNCRTAWRNLTETIGAKGLRMKDLRHDGVTKLDERGVSHGVIKKLAGWSPSSKLIDCYSHVGLKPVRAAVKLLKRRA